MLGTVGQLLPIALAAALSTVPIAMLLVIMLSERRRVAAIPFAVGCVLGTLLAVVVFDLLAQAVPDSRPRQADQLRGVAEVLLGAALLVLGIRAWRRRHEVEPGPLLPARASSVLADIGPAKAFGLGAVIEFRPKSLLLAGVAGLQIHAAPREASAVVLTVGYVLIATATVTLPVLLSMLSPRRMEPRLASAADSLSTEGPVISAVVMVMVGAVVVGFGLSDLS